MRWVFSLFICAALVGCHHSATVRSAGMEPTIRIGDNVLIDKTYYVNHDPQRFDIIAVPAPLVRSYDSTTPILLKRVIALGGEVVEIRHGDVLLNGKKLEEPYSVISTDRDFGPLTVPDGEYFLLGDNRSDSYDSRFWRPPTIKRADVIAKVTEVNRK